MRSKLSVTSYEPSAKLQCPLKIEVNKSRGVSKYYYLFLFIHNIPSGGTEPLSGVSILNTLHHCWWIRSTIQTLLRQFKTYLKRDVGNYKCLWKAQYVLVKAQVDKEVSQEIL